MAEFCHWKLSCDLSPSPTPIGPLRASIKQWGVRGRRASGDGSLPRRMKIDNREQTGGRDKVGEQETSDVALSGVQNLVVYIPSNPQPIVQPNNGRCVSPLPYL